MNTEFKKGLKEKALSIPKKRVKMLSKTVVISDENTSKKQALKNVEKMIKEVEEGKDKDHYIITPARLLTKAGKVEEKSISYISGKFRERLIDKERITETIDRVFDDLIADAYADRMMIYFTQSTEYSFRGLEKIQALRHKADNHLIQLIRAYKIGRASCRGRV